MMDQVAYDDAAPDLIVKLNIARLNAAGAVTIIAEVQRQMNDWAAANTQVR